MADWMDGEVDIPDVSLNNGQIFALLRMTKAMQSQQVVEDVAFIKRAIATGDLVFAGQLWGELTEDEQTALWVAPKFGGIFTTDERKIINGGFKDE